MSIGQWFKNLFSGRAHTDDSVGAMNEIDLDEARLNAGGGGWAGNLSHANPGEEAAESEGFRPYGE